jgi:hypothetical protein
MSSSEDRFNELKKVLQDQSDDEPVVITSDGTVQPVEKSAPGQSVVLRDPHGEYLIRPGARPGTS